MLFKNIGIVDENFDYVKSMFVETKDDRIVYVSSVRPENRQGADARLCKRTFAFADDAFARLCRKPAASALAE